MPFKVKYWDQKNIKGMFKLVPMLADNIMTINNKNLIYLLCIIFSQCVPSISFGNPLENYIATTEADYRWKHHLVIVRPKVIRNPDVAFLRIAGDGNGEKHIQHLKLLAERGGAIAGLLRKASNK